MSRPQDTYQHQNKRAQFNKVNKEKRNQMEKNNLEKCVSKTHEIWNNLEDRKKIYFGNRS